MIIYAQTHKTPPAVDFQGNSGVNNPLRDLTPKITIWAV